MPRRIRNVLVTTSFLAALGVSTVAVAQSGPGAKKPVASAKQEAAELKRAGDDAMASLKFAEALNDYERAYERDPSPALVYNRGRALQLLDRLPEALEAFERFKAEAPMDLLQKVPKLDELIAEIRGKVGTLTVACMLDGVDVVVGGRTVGTTPLAAPLRLKREASLVVEFRKEGYHPIERRLDLVAKATQSVAVNLEPKDTTALLVVSSPVPGAKVSIDTRDVGNAPAESFLPPGEHRVEVRADGYDDADMSVVLEAGQRKPLEVDLQKSTPVYKRWWLWTAVGAVVVTGVAVGVALTVEKPASTGDIAPGQVAAPLISF